MYSSGWCYRKNKSVQPWEDGTWGLCMILTQMWDWDLSSSWPSRSLFGTDNTTQVSSLWLLYALSHLLSTRALGEWPTASSWVFALEESTWDCSRVPPLLSRQRPTDFHCQRLCRLHFPALMFWVWGPSMGLKCHIPHGEHLQPRYPSSFSATLREHRSQPTLHLCTSYQSLYSFFCKFLDIILLFSYPSVGYSGWLLYNLAVNPLWHWEEVSIASTYSAAIWTFQRFLERAFIVWVIF